MVCEKPVSQLSLETLVSCVKDWAPLGIFKVWGSTVAGVAPAIPSENLTRIIVLCFEINKTNKENLKKTHTQNVEESI